MRLRLTDAAIRDVSGLPEQVLAVYHFVEDRPLRGMAGVVDWRLNGRLSRCIVEGWVTARLGDRALFTGGRRLGQRAVLLIGLGHREDYSVDRLRHGLLLAFDIARRMGQTSLCTELPGLSHVRISARQAVEILLTAFHQTSVAAGLPLDDWNVAIAVPADAMSEAREPLDDFQRRYGAMVR